MAKKELKDDLFDGGSISDGEKKNKSSKEKAKKKAEKLNAKRKSYENEIRELKAKLAEETDESKKQELKKQIAKAKNKLDNVGNGVTVAKDTKKIISSVVAVVLVVAILVTYVATGAVRKGFVHSTLQWTTGITAVTVKSEDGDKIKVPVSVYNYYYSTTYNSMKQTKELYEKYGLDASQADLDVDFGKALALQKTTDEDNIVITWEEKMERKTVESIKNVYTYYNEAVKANNGEEPEITEEQQKELDETLKSYKDAANKYGFTLSAYLVKAMGKGVTESVFRQESKRAYIAENYQKSLDEEKEEIVYTAEDYAKYKDEHLEDLKSVDVRIFEADSADDAKAFKNELKADGSNFTELCAKYAKEGFDKDYYTQDGASTQLSVTKETLKAMKSFAIATADDVNKKPEERTYSGLDWLFSADRKAGDINQHATTVVYVVAPARLSEVNLIDVRHILISPLEDKKSGDATKATAEQWAAAEKKANDILAEYNKGKKTEDSFVELAKNYSVDGSASKGGLYEDVYPNQMVNTFNAWCFDSSRKVGDVGIVKTEFGYHIMYFVGETETKAWENTAKAELTKIDSKTEADKLAEKYSADLNWFGSCYIEKDVDIDR